MNAKAFKVVEYHKASYASLEYCKTHSNLWNAFTQHINIYIYIRKK